ncbi:MAG: COG1470 family protein [Candidatus Bipolaricaulia bacterium]
MAGRRLAAKVGWGLGLILLFLLMRASPLSGQALSGRWEIGAELFPQTTSYEATAFEFKPYSQLDLSLDFEGLGLDGTLFFSNLGLEMVWLGWEATFPSSGKVAKAAMKRTLAQNDWVKVLRSFPSPVRPGEAFAVVIIIEALQSIPPGTEITVIEELPPGWALEPSAPPGVRVTKEAQQWTITLTGPGTREEIRYIGYVPSEAQAGSYPLSGTVRSSLFPDLAFNDTIEVILQAIPMIPAKTKLGQDLIFIDGTDLAFQMMLFAASVSLDSQLKLTNYLSLYNVGTAQTPSFVSRDTFIIEGETPGRLKTRLALRFSSETPLVFDSGSLQISGLTIQGLSLRSTTSFDGAGLERIALELDYPTTLFGLPLALKAGITYNAGLEMELDYFNIQLSSRFDGLLRFYDYYDWLKYDADDDGIEEAHFELKRRRMDLQFSLDKLEIRSTSTFEPILEDIDSDGANEKLAALHFARQELRLSRALKEFTLIGSFIWTAKEAVGAPLEPAYLRFYLLFTRSSLRLSGTMALNLKTQGFTATAEAAVSF